ncbi:hypothetical protein F5H01DRAFT_339707, partial [Linnemannia elongata]
MKVWFLAAALLLVVAAAAAAAGSGPGPALGLYAPPLLIVLSWQQQKCNQTEGQSPLQTLVSLIQACESDQAMSPVARSAQRASFQTFAVSENSETGCWYCYCCWRWYAL